MIVIVSIRSCLASVLHTRPVFAKHKANFLQTAVVKATVKEKRKRMAELAAVVHSGASSLRAFSHYDY